MLDLSQLEVTTEKETADFGKFIVEPLEQGYGYTVGNSLRRVLLTSLAGGAITQVKISQVRHQFSSLVGMSEDIVEFILNLKKVRLRISGEKPVKLVLDVKGPREVKAKDILPAAGVEIVNGDLPLAQLADSKAKLTAQIIAENGKGYLPTLERTTSEIGVIPIDANFSPITNVNYRVEATRVGRVTNYDRLIIEITTDGTVRPSDSLKQASKILVDHFMTIYQPQTGTKKDKKSQVVVELTQETLNASLEELDLPVRLTNSLKAGKIETIGDFLGKDKKELLRMKNMGPKSIELVEERLKGRGIEKT